MDFFFDLVIIFVKIYYKEIIIDLVEFFCYWVEMSELYEG